MSDSSLPDPLPRVEYWCELQCPDCATALDDVRALRDAYIGPPQAAEEAFAQGLGWPYVEAVLARTEELGARGEELLVEVARELGLDAEEMDTALIDGRHILVVDADHAEGKAIGVTGTPTYVVAGRRLDGGQSQDGLRAQIVGLLGPAE
jgi:predicted DsbA family dithiol-disulfide isomerase